MFGTRLPAAVRYAGLLAGPGVARGLLGPREVPRLWERHLLNCAAIAGLPRRGATVADLGSGAGLPGIVLAILRPDLQVVLLEPTARRADFLAEAVDLLRLTNATILRARAEDVTAELRVPVVTARAVAPLVRLIDWALPLLVPGGRLLAIKGRLADREVSAAAAAVRAAGAAAPRIRQCRFPTGPVGEPELPPVTVVEVRRAGATRRAGGRRGRTVGSAGAAARRQAAQGTRKAGR